MSWRTAKLSTPQGRLCPANDDARNLVSTGHHAHDLRESEKNSDVHSFIPIPLADNEPISTTLSTRPVDGRLSISSPLEHAGSVNHEQAAASGIKAVPKRYRGTSFRSTLEADWAATFDELGWHWEYEPVAVSLPSGENYRPDFYLPTQRVWCEVKGPHNERLKKTVDLQDGLGYDEWEWASDLVVVLRPPGPGEMAQWSGTRDDQDIVVARCPECEHYCFMDYNGLWSCRRHLRTQREPNKFWMTPGGALYWPGEIGFVRAP